MKERISVILFEEYENVNFYSFVIDNSEDCEMESFMLDLQNRGRSKDLKQIVNLLDRIATNGASERYFRYEGKKSDNVCALPDHFLIRTDCRLYCLRYGDAILILGNGGIKSTATYQQDPYLNKCVERLQKIDREIKKLISSSKIIIENKTITGLLEFYISK